MDLKQALQQQRSIACSSSINGLKNPISTSLQHGSSSTEDGGGANHSSCSNSTNTGEDSNHGTSSSPGAIIYHLFSCTNPSAGESSSPSPALFCGSGTTIVHSGATQAGPGCPASELNEVENTRLLKLARFHDPCSPHSTLETQALINLHGSSSCNFTNNNSSPLSFLGDSANNSNHPSPTSANYQSTNSLQGNSIRLHSSSSSGQVQLSGFSFNGGANSSPSALSKLYPYNASSMEEPRSQHPFLVCNTGSSSQAAGALNHLSSAATSNHNQLANFCCLNNPIPSSSLFTPEQLIELTQQTYVFKHFVAGITPPPALLLPIINSVASSISRGGAGPLHFGINAGLFGVGPLRGHVDLEPGRCRRTDGKKWRCAREVVPDQKYCERHMHRGRHRTRGKLNATTAVANSSLVTTTAATASTADLPKQPPNPPQNILSPTSAPALTSSSIISVAKEPQLQFSLQQPVSTHSTRSLGAILSSSASHLASRTVGEQPPNLADLLNGGANSAKFSLSHLSSNAKSQASVPFLFSNNCQSGNARDADNLALRQLVGPDWPSRMSRVADPPPAPTPTLSWIDQLAEEQSKRNQFNSELSNPSSRSPLSLSAKFGGDQHTENLVDTPNYMGLSIAASAKPKEEDGYASRSTWVPIAWDNPSIGGPLGEALHANGTNSGGNFSDSLANNGGEGCLNLIEESWDHDQEHAVTGSPAKDSHSHSHSLASPTGVLQMKASFGSYSDSSSSASSPRSALKLESAANLAI